MNEEGTAKHISTEIGIYSMENIQQTKCKKLMAATDLSIKHFRKETSPETANNR